MFFRSYLLCRLACRVRNPLDPVSERLQLGAPAPKRDRADRPLKALTAAAWLNAAPSGKGSFVQHLHMHT